MKKVILLLAVFMFVQCVTDEDRANFPKPKYKVGDIVYMKPDSTKCMIYYYGGNAWNPCYAVQYTNKEGTIIRSGTGWSNSLIKENMFY